MWPWHDLEDMVTLSTGWSWSMSTADGETLDLNDIWSSGVAMADGPAGVGLPPVALSSDPRPQGNGSVPRGVRYGEVDLFLPLLLMADDPISLSVIRRKLQRFMNPLRGPVTVHVAHATGERRRIAGFYQGGLEGDYAGRVVGRIHEIRGVTIRCFEPLWFGEPIEPIGWNALQTSKTFLSTTELFFPVELNSSIAGGSVTVTNAGDTDAQPIWTITGPGEDLEVSNVATGESWSLTQPIAAGQTIVVDTRELQETVTDATTGDNLFSWLGPNPHLWHLQQGTNEVSVDIIGANADTRITLAFEPRYLSAG